MKGIFKYIIAFSVIGGFISSCVDKEDLLLPDSGSKDSSTLLIASVDNFDRHDVTTKADDVTAAETAINDLSVLLFGKVGNDAELQLLTDKPLYIDGAKLNFLINTSKDTDGNVIGGHIYNIQEPNNILSINTSNVTSCRLYIVANMQSFIEAKGNDVKTETGFLTTAYSFTPQGMFNNQTGIYEDVDLSDIGTREGGFPMMGYTDEVSLSQSSQNAITVTMKKLFAKVNFKFLVKLDADGPGTVNKITEPYFDPTSWRVYNVPANITLGTDVDGEDKVFSTDASYDFEFNLASSKQDGKIYDSTGDDYFGFTFYIPEHVVTPARTRNNVSVGQQEEHLLQCWKPTFCDDNQSPTYVEIIGDYSDHQGYISTVTYRLYLGQNEIDDFNVYRNQELNNIVTVKGLTNHDEANETTVSIDHRVHISSTGYSIALERETLLDSHFEVRPMLITVQKGYTVSVKVPKYAWFAAESADDPLAESGYYDSQKPGLRKYFTTNLVSDLWKGTTGDYKIFEFEADDVPEGGSKTHTLWFYFDENVNMKYDDKDKEGSDPLFREGTVEVFLNETQSDIAAGTVEPDRRFAFRQMSLWAINSETLKTDGTPERQYGIEYFEEYLYNYASDDNYGVTRDGMEWGLNNDMLSWEYSAIYMDTYDEAGLIAQLQAMGWDQKALIDKAFGQVSINYDFYLNDDNPPTGAYINYYNGLDFTKRIVNKINIDDNVLTLSGSNKLSSGKEHNGPASAVEYCFNKNKRDTEGNVQKIHWYLPAIDETEEILEAGFDYFPVFQSKYYWSSQPAYKNYDYIGEVAAVLGLVNMGDIYGKYYTDDTSRARATIVTQNKTGEESGTKGPIGLHSFNIYRGIFIDTYVTGSQVREYNTTDGDKYIANPYHPGNQPRTTKNRVRCAYSAEGIATTN